MGVISTGWGLICDASLTARSWPKDPSFSRDAPDTVVTADVMRRRIGCTPRAPACPDRELDDGVRVLVEDASVEACSSARELVLVAKPSRSSCVVLFWASSALEAAELRAVDVVGVVILVFKSMLLLTFDPLLVGRKLLLPGPITVWIGAPSAPPDGGAPLSATRGAQPGGQRGLRVGPWRGVDSYCFTAPLWCRLLMLLCISSLSSGSIDDESLLTTIASGGGTTATESLTCDPGPPAVLA